MGNYSKPMLLKIGTVKEPQKGLVIDFMVQPESNQ